MWYLLRMTPQTSEPKDWWAPRGWAEEQALRVAQEVRRLRGSRSAQWLAGETKQCGHEVTRSVIADLENGRRRYVTTAELTVFGDSSHMPHWEERDRYMEVVGSWLRRHDPPYASDR